MKRPVLIVDGLNLFIRHFVVNPTLNDSGDHVGGLVGFLRALRYLVERTSPSRVIIVWEGGGSNRKRALYKDYKKGKRPQKLNRYYGDEIPDTVENRNSQISLVISILKNVPVDQMYINDCEADDIIGYIIRNKKMGKFVVASSDKDLYQLLSKDVVQWSPGQKKFITLLDVLEKFNVSAVNFCTVRSFTGDSSDNISGVPLAGFTSMTKRFPELSENKFVSVDNILESAQKNFKNTKLKLIKNIIEQPDLPRLNWRLMYLDINNLASSQIEKIEFMLENPAINRNKLLLIKSFTRLGIKNFDIDSFYLTLTSVGKNN